MLNPTPNMPGDVARHLPVAEASASSVLGSVKAAKAKDIDALLVQLHESLSARTPAKNRLTRIRHIAGEYSSIFSSKSACAGGCSHCCHIDVSVPRSEAVLISRLTGRPMSEPALTLPVDEFAATSHVGEPCPFLDDGKCSIYVHRPLMCRTLVNLDLSPKLCELVPGVEIPVPYLNTTNLKTAFIIISKRDDFADIREWFPRP